MYIVKFHFENIPLEMRKDFAERFVYWRELAVAATDQLFEELNDKWEKTGKEFSLGPYMEDLNPEYVEFMISKLQPVVDEKVNRFSGECRIAFSKWMELEMTITTIKGSRVWVTIEEM